MYSKSTYWAKTHSILFVGLVLLIAGCGIIEKRILYSPKSSCQFWDSPIACETSGLEFQDVFFCSDDGIQLHGWFVAPAETKPRHCVLFSHGRTGNISSFKTQLLDFARTHQVAVFAYDYRGFGKSQGEPSEAGLYLDADAASNWLCNHSNLEPTEIVVMGRSLGAAVAIDLVNKDGAKALIVESGFTSFADIVQHHSRGLLSGKRCESKYDSESKIGSYQGPILISHGVDDKLIPCYQGVKLAEAATSKTTQFVKVAGGHKPQPNPKYQQQLNDFFSYLSSRDCTTN